MKIKGTQTENNLRSAIAGEAQAALLYELFARRAKKDGYEKLAEIFEETSRNEKAHAEIYLKLLECLNTSDANLLSAAETEHHEHTQMYPAFAETAKQEGFTDVATTFEMVAKIESEHEERFRKNLASLQNGTVFSKSADTEWICLNCGHHAFGTDAPTVCPVCHHPRAFFAPVCNCV